MLPSSFCVCALSLSRVQRFATPWAVAHQVPLFMEFSSREYWSGLPFPTPGDLPDSGIEPSSLASLVLAGGFFTTEPPGKPTHILLQCINFPCSLVRPNLLLLLFHAYLQSSLLSVAFFSSSSSSFPALPDHTHQYTNMLWHHPLQETSKKLMAPNQGDGRRIYKIAIYKGKDRVRESMKALDYDMVCPTTLQPSLDP